MVNQVARGFSCAVSGFGRVIIVVSIFGRRTTAETVASCQVCVKKLLVPSIKASRQELLLVGDELEKCLHFLLTERNCFALD